MTTIYQWSSTFCIYAAVLTEQFLQRALGLFKHMSDVSDMARKYPGMAWKTYDECFRRDMQIHSLSFGNIHWDVRFFRCLERNANFAGNSFRNRLSRYRTFQKGQCYLFGACRKSACSFRHACAKRSGKHPTARCEVGSPYTAARRFGTRGSVVKNCPMSQPQ